MPSRRRRKPHKIRSIEITFSGGETRAHIFWTDRKTPSEQRIKTVHNFDNWEDLVHSIIQLPLAKDTDETQEQIALVKWNNGPDSWEGVKRLQKECPNKLLEYMLQQFYQQDS